MSEHLQPQIQMNAIQDMMVRLEYVCGWMVTLPRTCEARFVMKTEVGY